MKIISIISVSVGIVFLLVGIYMPKYSNYAEFESIYLTMPYDTEAYEQLRERYLTMGFILEDYGLSIIFCRHVQPYQ